ncbi:19731_t:CDS:1, partial [Racocetra persica]
IPITKTSPIMTMILITKLHHKKDNTNNENFTTKDDDTNDKTLPSRRMPSTA